MTLHYLIQLDMLLQVNGITAGRAAALLPGVLALISVATGWWSLARSTSETRNRKVAAITSLVAGAIGIGLSGLHLVRSAGNSFGTGSGRLGAIIALVLGVIGMVLGGIALARFKKAH